MSTDPLVLFMPSGKRGPLPRRHARAGCRALARRLCGIRLRRARQPAAVARSRCRKAISQSTRSSRPTTTSRHAGRKKSATTASAACRSSAAFPARRPSRATSSSTCRRTRWSTRRVVRKAATDRVIERNAAIQLCYVEVEEPDMHKPLGDLDRLKVSLEKDWGWKDLLVAPHLIPKIQKILRTKLPDQPEVSEGKWGVTAVVHRDMDSSRPFIIDLYPGLKNEAYGIALRHRLHHHRHASGFAAVGPHCRLIRHVEPADSLRRGSDEPRLLRHDESRRPRGDDQSGARSCQFADRKGLR